jgi:hypothetical protein
LAKMSPDEWQTMEDKEAADKAVTSSLETDGNNDNVNDTVIPTRSLPDTVTTSTSSQPTPPLPTAKNPITSEVLESEREIKTGKNFFGSGGSDKRKRLNPGADPWSDLWYSETGATVSKDDLTTDKRSWIKKKLGMGKDDVKENGENDISAKDKQQNMGRLPKSERYSDAELNMENEHVEPVKMGEHPRIVI